MNKIKVLREKSGKTQAEIAEKLGLDRSTVCKWETGESLPRADNLLRLAKVLDCTLDELLREDAS